MFGLSEADLKIVPWTMTGIEPASSGNCDGLARFIDEQSWTKTLVSPAQANHLVVRGPMQESIVRGVQDKQSSA